ncbi:MAG: PRC-barrel domain-containing protein [Rhodospirillaceae bacterium]
MQPLELRRTAAAMRLALVPVACLSLLSACATYESQPAPVAASASLPTPAELQNYRAVRASDLIGKTVRNQNGEYMGQVRDLVVQMGTGAVRYAVVSSGSDTRLYPLPVHSIRMGAGNDIVIDLARPRLADYRGWTQWPDLHDAGYWSELDRVSGFPPVRSGHGYDRLSQLRGKLVVDAKGEHLGRVEDFVINASTDVLHYAIVALDPGRAGGGRLVAVPLHAFAYPREGVNRLALRIDASRLAQLETFDAARWAQINDPRYVVQMDRYFTSAFPISAASLFEQLDTNRDGFLSRAELAPLQMAGTDRYALRGAVGDTAAFRAFDRDGDGFLSQSEAQGLLRGASFARYDTNGDGFISMAEAAPLVDGAPAAYFASLPIKAILAELRAAGIPAEISQTAGTYVCNAVFYGLMHGLQARASVRGGFVHIPYSPEQAAAHPGAPSLPTDIVVAALRIILDFALTTRDDRRIAAGAEH